MASLRESLKAIREYKGAKFYGYWNNNQYIGIRVRSSDEDNPRSEDSERGVTVRNTYQCYRVDGGVEDFEVMPDVAEEPCVHIDESAFFQLYRRVRRMMDIEYPVYSYFLDSCQLIRDPKISSIGVTFDEVVGRYCIYYNPRWCLDFCVRFAQHADSRRSVEMNLIRAFQFLFMHEVSHVFRKHVNGMIDAETREEHALNNLFEDAFINNELMRVLDVNGMPEGVLNLVTVCGKAPKGYVQDDLVDLVYEWLGTFANKESERYWYRNDSWVIDEGDDMYVDFQLSRDVYRGLFGDSSVKFVNRMKQLVGFIFESDVEPDYTDFSTDFELISSPIDGDDSQSEVSPLPVPSPSDAECDEISGSGDGESGDEVSDGESGNESVGGDGSDGSGDQSDENARNGDLGDDVSGQSGRKPENVEVSTVGDDSKDPAEPWREKRPSALERSVFKDILNGAYHSVSDVRPEQAVRVTSGSGRGHGGGEMGLLEKMGVTRLLSNRQMTPLWKRRLRSLLSDCISSTEEYDAERPHARIEGQFGSEVDVDYPQRIVLGIDCSGSMGPEKFREVLNEIDNFLRVSRLYEVEIPVVYWGDKAVSKVFRYNRGLLKEIEDSAVSCGGTELCQLVGEVKSRFPRYDALIIFTDGEFWSITREEFNSLSRKPLWVITSEGTTNEVERVDRGYSRRLIKVGQV